MISIPPSYSTPPPVDPNQDRPDKNYIIGEYRNLLKNLTVAYADSNAGKLSDQVNQLCHDYAYYCNQHPTPSWEKSDPFYNALKKLSNDLLTKSKQPDQITDIMLADDINTLLIAAYTTKVVPS